MNLKPLRKHYGALTVWERFSLYSQAAQRNDQVETTAIAAASPKRYYQTVDLYPLDRCVKDLQLANLLERLSHAAMFDCFLQAVETATERAPESVIDGLLGAGYLYAIETDAWAAVGAEFGFSVAAFRQTMAACNAAVQRMGLADKLMREMAFTEAGMKQVAARNGHNPEDVKTLASLTAGYRTMLLDAEKCAA